MNTIGKLMSTAILAGAVTAMSTGPLWAQATDNAPTESAFAERESNAELVVQNNNWLDAHLYVVRGGMRTSWGFMTALATRKFELPLSGTRSGDDVQILVHLIGGPSFLTRPVDVYGGDVVELVIQNNLALGGAGLLPAG
jgi:hypothetical protein